MNLKDVQLLVTDVDGVMTDDTFIYADDGHKRLRFNNADGQGILRLRERLSIPTWFLTQESNPDIEMRANGLGCRLIIGGMHKWQWLQRFMDESGYLPRTTAYIGNDWNDIEVLSRVGVAFVPRDAVIIPSLNASVTDPWEVLHRPGGQGCVREVCDMILAAQGAL